MHFAWVEHDITHWRCYWPYVRGIHWSPVNSTHKGQWRRALMFSFTCVWINGWVNNRETGDLKRHRAHHDVIVMCRCSPFQQPHHFLHAEQLVVVVRAKLSIFHMEVGSTQQVGIVFLWGMSSDGVSSWWLHQMGTFSALLALCVGNSPVTGEFPSQRPVTRSFGVFFDLRQNKRVE